MPKSLNCPSCNRPIDLGQTKDWVCPHCHDAFRVADAYNRNAALFTMAGVALIGLVSHDSSSDGKWLLGTILSALPLWFLFLTSVPLYLEKGSSQPRLTIVGAYISATFSIFVFGLIGMGGMYLLLGASHRDLQEHLQMFSFPLAYIDRNFLIQPGKTFAEVCGIVMGNSVFFGLLVFACYHPIRYFLRRNRPTQLAITDSAPTEDD
jgi:hypothetical protein